MGSPLRAAGPLIGAGYAGQIPVRSAARLQFRRLASAPMDSARPDTPRVAGPPPSAAEPRRGRYNISGPNQAMPQAAKGTPQASLTAADRFRMGMLGQR